MDAENVALEEYNRHERAHLRSREMPLGRSEVSTPLHPLKYKLINIIRGGADYKLIISFYVSIYRTKSQTLPTIRNQHLWCR